MNIYHLIIITAIGLVAIALSAWAWTAAKRVGKALANGFEGIHFDL